MRRKLLGFVSSVSPLPLSFLLIFYLCFYSRFPRERLHKIKEISGGDISFSERETLFIFNFDNVYNFNVKRYTKFKLVWNKIK